jgi:hypothetical protein
VSERELPEWLRAAALFVLTFALISVLGGLAGIKIKWTDPAMSPEVYNQP